jgi:glycosyltransferase involved in cell wall biosynthesis
MGPYSDSETGADANRGVVFVTPTPAMLRAGAVWVTINNWVHASRRRWGKASLLTPSGFLTDEHLRDAAWGGATEGARVTQRFGRFPLVAQTAAKDVRAWWRMSRFRRSVRGLTLDVDPLFVWQHHDLFQRAGLTVARRHDVPLVLFVDAPVVWETSSWGVNRPGWGRLLERLAETPQFREADVVACVSEEVAEAATARGARPETIMITPCTADGVRLAHPTDHVKDELSLRDSVVVGWVGSFRPFHNADSLVRAFGQLPVDLPVTLMMVGDGPTLESCRRMAAFEGIRRAVFTGPVRHEEIPNYLAAIDIAVITPSEQGGFHYSPLKLKEYLAAGKAIVAPNAGEITRMLSHGQDVYLYPSGEEAEMTRAIFRLAQDAVQRERLGSNARETYDQLFTIDRQLDALETRINLV